MILIGDCLEELRKLDAGSVNCCITSPPYWRLRDYGVSGQLGLEQTPQEYVRKMVAVFAEVRRILRDDGTLWLNLGDSYGADGNRNGLDASTLQGSKTYGRGADSDRPNRQQETGLKRKDLVGIPWRVAFALQADGWYLRQDIIWAKPNPMPESVRDRCTKAHEYLFLLAKSERYYYDADAIAEEAQGWNGSSFTDERDAAVKIGLGQGPRVERDTRNKRSVWTVATQPYAEAHFATFPPALIEPCVLAGCPIGGTVLDCFGGSGTVGQVAENLGRKWVLIELNPAYAKLAEDRTRQTGMVFA